MPCQIKFIALTFAVLCFVPFYQNWRQVNPQAGQAAICATIRAGVAALLLHVPMDWPHHPNTRTSVASFKLLICCEVTARFTRCVPVFLSLVSIYHWAMIISVFHSPVQDVWHYRKTNSKRHFNLFPAQCPVSADFIHSEANNHN